MKRISRTIRTYGTSTYHTRYHLNYVPLPNKMTAAPQHGRRNILEPKER